MRVSEVVASTVAISGNRLLPSVIYVFEGFLKEMTTSLVHIAYSVLKENNIFTATIILLKFINNTHFTGLDDFVLSSLHSHVITLA